MLVGFYQYYLLLVGVCVLFCLLANLYNLFFHLTYGFRDALLESRIKGLVELITSTRLSDEKRAARLGHTLRNGLGLRALYGAMERLDRSAHGEVSDDTLQALRRAMERNLPRYRRSSAPVCSLAILLGGRLGLDSEEYGSFLISCLSPEAPSYLRIAAMRGCGQMGNKKQLRTLLEIISRQPNTYSVKLITDILPACSPQSKPLFEELWNGFESYSQNVRCGIINAMAEQQAREWAERIFDIMQSESAPHECRIAAIKYFGRVEYPDAEPVLLRILMQDDWECSGVAAGALQNYKLRQAGDELLYALSSRNWYVRRNSAMTIVRRRPDLLQSALRHEDRYGREIMQYALNVSRQGGA